MPRPTAFHQNPRPTLGRREKWLRLAAILAIVLFAVYSAWNRQRRAGHGAADNESPPEVTQELPRRPADRELEPAPNLPEIKLPAGQAELPRAATGDDPPDAAAIRTKISNQRIRDERSDVVFRGDVDVGPTLARIERGERLRFSHDGATFENRERRLPRQPPGYYQEFVHPTPGLGGPGPQRIVVGREGEIYYTPDHYRTFQRLDKR
jgi:filamentous hemagglutinin